MGDLDIGDMGMMDSMGLSIPIPEPALDETPESLSAAMAVPPGMPIPMTDQPSVSFGASLGLLDGQGGAFYGDLSAAAFPSAGADALPDIAPSLPVPADPISITEPLSGESSPEAFAMPPVHEPMAFGVASPGVASGLGGLPDVSIPFSPSPSFRDVGASVEDMMDFQLALAPPEPAVEGFSSASDAPTAAISPSLSAQDLGDRMAMRLRDMESVASQAFGPMLGSELASPDRGGSSPVIHVHNVHLPGVNGREFTSSLLALSSTGTSHDLSLLKA